MTPAAAHTIILAEYDPDARQQYEDLKRRLASELEDVEAYADAKSDFVRDVLARAKAAGIEVAL